MWKSSNNNNNCALCNWMDLNAFHFDHDIKSNHNYILLLFSSTSVRINAMRMRFFQTLRWQVDFWFWVKKNILISDIFPLEDQLNYVKSRTESSSNRIVLKKEEYLKFNKTFFVSLFLQPFVGIFGFVSKTQNSTIDLSWCIHNRFAFFSTSFDKQT